MSSRACEPVGAYRMSDDIEEALRVGCHVCDALPHQWCYSVDGVSYLHAMRLENVNLMENMRVAVDAARESEPSNGRDLGASDIQSKPANGKARSDGFQNGRCELIN